MSFRFPADGEAAAPVRRTWWTCKLIKNSYDEDEEQRQRVGDEREALLVASLTENGYHAPALDFDLPVETIDRGEGVTRMRFPGLVLRARPWRKLLAHLVDVKDVELPRKEAEHVAPAY